MLMRAAHGVTALTVVVFAVWGTTGCKGRDPRNVDGFVSEGEGEGEGEGDLPAACSEDTNKPVTPSLPRAIYFGTRAPTLAPLSAQQLNAVVSISDDQTEGAFCSGTLISADVVMTAVHCTTGIGAQHLRVLFGEDDLNPVATIGVQEKHETDADTDITILKLAHAAADDVDVVPIPINVEAPSEDLVGVLVENAGFGEVEDLGYHGRYFVTELLDGFDDAFVQVNGQGTRGVCFGDSGGPSLIVTAAGDVRTLGALSFGDSACMNVDNYARADAIKDFIEAVTGPTPAAVPEACGPVTEAGTCNLEQALATYCVAGNVERDLCKAGEVCGDDGAGNARCISIADNPCGAVTAFGACDGGALSWCDGGAVKTRDCEACGERCLLVAPDQGYTCAPSDCGDLDRIGACDGAVSQWCDNYGQKATYDCADDDTTCEYLGEELGYFCLDQEACQGFDFLGACDGTVLKWCEDNEYQEVDCADAGGTCVFVSDDVGFDCTK